ncbi:hypothetical protein PIB30_103890 [Stylosanthes scabra]|uniref:Uncharacterized protein n=1 Tax=Stylosanthes scabra TaxID=79078 RepID=A0ABU6QZI7_9FABA|nr:hypothetical protein [Stylosanthes scabra]
MEQQRETRGKSPFRREITEKRYGLSVCASLHGDPLTRLLYPVAAVAQIISM